MSKNTKVATAQESKTTVAIKVPTGKVITMEQKKARKEAREKAYENFRVNALKRRCKRMGLSEEQTKVKVEELTKQIRLPNTYTILILFNKNDADMVKQALLKESLEWKVISNSHVWLDGDQEVLATIREIMPPSAKIHPYAKKKPNILPMVKKKTDGYVSKNTDKSHTAKFRRNAKKAEKLRKKLANIRAHSDSKLHAELQKKMRMNNNRKIAKALHMLHKKLQKASNSKGGTIVHMKAKKASSASKKASKTLIPRRRQNMKKAA